MVPPGTAGGPARPAGLDAARGTALQAGAAGVPAVSTPASGEAPIVVSRQRSRFPAVFVTLTAGDTRVDGTLTTAEEMPSRRSRPCAR